jgi:hypothetical protein
VGADKARIHRQSEIAILLFSNLSYDWEAGIARRDAILRGPHPPAKTTIAVQVLTADGNGFPAGGYI